MLCHESFWPLASLPTAEKICGVYGAVWLMILAALAAAAFAHRMFRLIRVLAKGRRENRLDHIGQRIALFLKEVVGQSRMWSGESIINWAHPLVFWGFCCFVLASALMFTGGMFDPFLAAVLPAGWHVPQAEEIPLLGTIVDVFAVLVFAALVASSTVMHIGLACWWTHLFILLFFLVYLPYSKHMHLIWAPFAVFFGELPGKKGTLEPPAEAEPAAATEAAAEGTGAAEPVVRQLGAFTWRQLMNAYTCAECGRCERQCPAFASGASLSPRQIVHDLKEFVLGEGLAAVGGAAGAPAQRVGGKALVGQVVKPEVLWGCTTCYACMEACPVRNEHVPLMVEMRRKLVERGAVDARLQEALMSLQRYGNSLGASPRKRFDWAKDLPQPIKDAEKEPVETLWFLGDYAAFHPSSARVSRMVALLFQAMGLNFGCLLRSEKSAGNDVRRSGEEGLFEMLAEQNMKALGKARFQRIVTTDPHTYHVLRHEYPRFGLTQPVYHYSEILDEAIGQGRLALRQKLEGTAVLHDACYLGRYNGIFDPPRRVLDALGLGRREMPRSREHSFCCGAGGGKIWMEEDAAVRERPALLRIREALAMQGVTHFVVTCPKDLGMFEDAVKTVGAEGRLRVVDLGELVFEAT